MTTVSDRTLDGPHGPLRVRTSTPDAPVGPVPVWLHGGGFFAGDLDTPVLAEWTGMLARSLDAAGVEVDVSTEPGTTHGHLNTPGSAATATVDRFAARLLALRPQDLP